MKLLKELETEEMEEKLELTSKQESLTFISQAEKRYAVMKKGVIYTPEFMQKLNNNDRVVLLLVYSQLWFTKDDEPFSNGILEVDLQIFNAFNIDASTVRNSVKRLETNGFLKILDDNVIKILPVWKN